MGNFLLRTDGAYEWYKDWSNEDLFLTFKGDFNHDMVKTLTKLTKGKDLVKGIKKKAQMRLLGVLIECMQNISVHGVSEEGKKLTPGILILANKGDRFTIASGNFVTPEKETIIKTKIDTINQMSIDELKESQVDIVNESNFEDKRGGFGLIFIKRRACSELRYSFKSFNDKNLFYSFEVDIAAE